MKSTDTTHSGTPAGMVSLASYEQQAVKPATGLSAFILASSSLWQRELVRFFRQVSRVIGAFGTPVLFWFIIGSGLGSSFRPADVAGTTAESPHYLQYFFSGTLLLIVMFTSIFSTISIIQDRQNGFLQGVLVSPAPRGALVMGKLLGGATLAVLQALLFLCLAPLAGIQIGLLTGFYLAGATFLVAFAMTGFGFMLAWPMESIQGYHGVMNLILMPMWLLSGALFPPSGASGWVRAIMLANPLTYGLSLLRGALAPGMLAQPGLGVSAVVMAVFGAATFGISWYMVCRRKTTPQ